MEQCTGIQKCTLVLQHQIDDAMLNATNCNLWCAHTAGQGAKGSMPSFIASMLNTGMQAPITNALAILLYNMHMCMFGINYCSSRTAAAALNHVQHSKLQLDLQQSQHAQDSASKGSTYCTRIQAAISSVQPQVPTAGTAAGQQPSRQQDPAAASSAAHRAT
jgi:hypothetical protein